MDRAPARKGGKADGWFDVHTPDGRRLHTPRASLAPLVAELDADDRTPGWFSRCATDLGLSDVLAEVADITKETNPA